jgi:hypothetical protein
VILGEDVRSCDDPNEARSLHVIKVKDIDDIKMDARHIRQ